MRPFCRIANQRFLAVLVVGVVAFLGSAIPYLLYSRSLHPFSAWSFFNAYDEFSYLLSADTFSSGRLTNPTHPLWRHFETRSVIHQPTYQSMYPPGQGLFLALGQWLTGHPIVGVWISMALASSATCYLLQVWFPPRWALLGGLLTALHPRMALEWGGTYWGGAVAMLGGALLFGGLRRTLDRFRTGDALLFALGLALLANSRPLEGLVASIPATALLARRILIEKTLRAPVRLSRVVAPIAVVLSLAAASMGYYNYRVTGDPWRLPYQVYLAAHEDEGTFIWRPLSETRVEVPDPPPLEGSRYDWWVANLYNWLVWNESLAVATLFKVAIQWLFFVGPLLTLPLAGLFFALGGWWNRFALGVTGLTLAAVLTTSNALPHYLAPVAPLFFVLVVQGTRSLGLWRRRRGKRIGSVLAPTLLALWAAQWLVAIGLLPNLLDELRWAEPRALMAEQLERIPGNHLVFVRYAPGHVFYQEWVHNRADIDKARVVWARELSPSSNRRLLAYFEDRKVWLVEPDQPEPALIPYGTDR